MSSIYSSGDNYFKSVDTAILIVYILLIDSILALNVAKVSKTILFFVIFTHV